MDTDDADAALDRAEQRYVNAPGRNENAIICGSFICVISSICGAFYLRYLRYLR